jgi:hypothetical protein
MTGKVNRAEAGRINLKSLLDIEGKVALKGRAPLLMQVIGLNAYLSGHLVCKQKSH